MNFNLETINRKLSKIVQSRFKKGSSYDNVFIPKQKDNASKGFICVQSSIDSGEGLTFNQRARAQRTQLHKVKGDKPKFRNQ